MQCPARHLISFGAVLGVILGAKVAPGAASLQETLTVEPTAVVTWADMLAHEARAPERARVVEKALRRMPPPPPREAGTPRAFGVRRGSEPLGRPEPRVLGPTVTTGLPALGDNNQSIPPDTMGAVGPAHLMTMLNTQVRIQTRSGTPVSTVSLATFWTGVSGLVGDPFDPHLVYDSLSGRWLATVFADGDFATSKVWFAISAGSNPTGTWAFYQFKADPAFPAGTTWADFPWLGVNAAWIAITANMFTVAGSPAFVGAKMWVIDKATALAGGTLTVTVFLPGFDGVGGFDGFALSPAVTFSAGEPTLYIVDSSGWVSGGTALLRLSRITGTGPAPSWSVQPGSSFPNSGEFFVANNFDNTQVGAPQLGTGGLIDSGDTRMHATTFRNGRLWGVHTGGRPVGAVNRTAVFWYQLNPAAMPAPIVQSGVLDGGAGVHLIFPSITANAANDAFVGLSRTDATRFAEAVYTSRNAADTAGSMGPLTLLKAGEDSYVKDFGQGVIRWGDFSATSVDPLDDTNFWTIQEYAALDVGPTSDDDRWGTWWGTTAVVPPPPPSLLSGRRLLVSTPPSGPARNKVVYQSRDPGIIAPQWPGEDPRCVPDGSGSTATGGTFRVAGLGGAFTIDLPCANWFRSFTGDQYTYRDVSGGTCAIILIKQGRLQKAVCRGSQVAYTLGSAQGDVSVKVTTGAAAHQRQYCATFGPSTGGNIVKDGSDARTYKALNAAAPSSCAGTASSTTTTTTSSTTSSSTTTTSSSSTTTTSSITTTTLVACCQEASVPQCFDGEAGIVGFRCTTFPGSFTLVPGMLCDAGGTALCAPSGSVGDCCQSNIPGLPFCTEGNGPSFSSSCPSPLGTLFSGRVCDAVTATCVLP